ncbi:MAG: S-layer protein [Methanomicrobiaceae archaeon]|nr:S-layer protein [Methanomicrobiaceae archaeon]
MRDKKTKIPGQLFLILIFFSLTAGHACGAGEQFLGSEPSLYATIQGDSELYPGTYVTLNIVVENHAVDNEGLRGLQYASFSINPTTALGTMIDLRAEDAPVKIKTEPFMAGDIAAGSTSEGSYYVYVDEDAKKGRYNLVLHAEYSYISATTLIEPGRWDYIYKEKTEDIQIPIEIKGVVKPKIISVSTKNLSPGKKGEIEVVIKNIGYETGYNAAAEISAASGVIRFVDGSVFTGDFLPGDTKEIVFSADVEDGAGEGIYPETLLITYTDSYGKIKSSVSENFGVEVIKGPKFRIVSDSFGMNPGEKSTLSVVFQNYGDDTAYSAMARIIPDSPFNAETDTAILGDIKPGENKTAYFKISMDSDALIVPYGINTEIKYRDESDRLILSDQMKIVVCAEDGSILTDIITNPIAIAVLLGAVFLFLYFFNQKRS